MTLEKLIKPIAYTALALGIFSGASNIKANCYDFKDFAIFASDFLKTTPNPAGDINGDKRADFRDFALLANNFMKTGNGLEGDLDGNGSVDYNDFAMLANDFGRESPVFAGDIDGDKTVDFRDLEILTESWICSHDLAYSLEPYVMAFDENTEKIRMKTDVNTTVEVTYGKTLAYKNSVVDGGNNPVHEFTLINLRPGTLYYYDVNASDGNKTSNFKSKFITSNNLEKVFSFGYFGDSRGGDDICQDVGEGIEGKAAYQSMLERMVKKGVKFVILGGDGVQGYNCPDTPETYDSAWQNFHNFSHPLRGDLSIPYLSALGNHEVSHPYSQIARDAFARYWMHPLNGEGLENSCEEATFSWRYGNTNFIFLNSEEPGNYGRMGNEQLDWFVDAVQEPGFDNKFVISHRAVVGSIRTDANGAGALQGNDPCMSAYMDNLMYYSDVSAGLYSHDHYYAYVTTSYPDGNMIHIISGGAGAKLKDCCKYNPKPPFNEFGTGEFTSTISESYCESNNCIWHYIIIDVDNNSMEGTVYNSDGNEFHKFKKIKKQEPE